MRNIKIMIKFLILTFVVMFSAVFMSGCGETEAKVENFMKIADDFVGERIVTIDFGKDFAKEKDKQKILENIIKENCPPVMSCRSEVQDGHYRCIFVVSFSSVDDYKIKVASIIGNQIAVAFGYTDSVLAKGTYYKEDYDGIELVSWLADSLYQKILHKSVQAELHSRFAEGRLRIAQPERRLENAERRIVFAVCLRNH